VLHPFPRFFSSFFLATPKAIAIIALEMIAFPQVALSKAPIFQYSNFLRRLFNRGFHPTRVDAHVLAQKLHISRDNRRRESRLCAFDNKRRRKRGKERKKKKGTERDTRPFLIC